jgi:hypothetical protein
MQYFADESTADSTAQSTQTEEKTFSQDDVNKLVSRESKSAVEKLLKEVGIAPDGDYKTSMKAFKEWQDKQKTELEKATGSLSAAEQAKSDAESKALALEQKFAAVAKGIPADKADKYVKLAEAYVDDKTDFGKALDMALKDFPVPGQAQRQPFVPPNPAVGDTSTNPNAAMNALIRSKF